jgi:hypothetical protein
MGKNVLLDRSVHLTYAADAGLITQGAGKSTLTAAIFRLAELSAGTISVDDVNLVTVPLRDVRGHAVCLIAQESLLFSGTLRYACQCRAWQLLGGIVQVSHNYIVQHRAPCKGLSMHNRSNVDLFGEFDDQAIWDVLSKINMRKVVAGLRGKVRQSDNNPTVRRVFIRLRASPSIGYRVSSVFPHGC